MLCQRALPHASEYNMFTVYNLASDYLRGDIRRARAELPQHRNLPTTMGARALRLRFKISKDHTENCQVVMAGRTMQRKPT
jgi:hypothetical protein